MLRLSLAIAFLLINLGAAKRAVQVHGLDDLHQEDGVEGGWRGEPVNYDRLTCRRQDDLDLALPADNSQVIRMVIPVGDSTGSDVYLSVSDLWIKRISAKLVLTRTGGSGFSFELSGEQGPDKDGGVAVVELWVRGVDIRCRSSWIDWGASLAADRAQLAEGQRGTLRFKLSGQGTAVWKEETGNWDLQLADRVTKPFEFEFPSQYILQKLLNNFGGIDAVMMTALWSAVEKLLPQSLIASFNYLKPDELSTGIVLDISGGAPTPQEPVALTMSARGSFDTRPQKLLEVLVREFDAADAAELRLRRFLEQNNFDDLVAQSRPVIVATLARYGISSSFLYEADMEPAMLRERLVAAVRRSTDAFVSSLEPFTSAHKKGYRDIFQGLDTSLEVSAGWSRQRDSGRLSGFFCSPAANEVQRTLVRLPQRLSASFGLAGLLPPPPEGATSGLQLGGLLLQAGRAQVERVAMQNLRVAQFGANGTLKTWKFGGVLRDVTLLMPASWDPGFEIAVADVLISQAPSGSLALSTGGRGVEFTEAAPPAGIAPSTSTGRLRRGPLTALDGAVPQGLQRPMQARPGVDKASMAPEVQTTAGVTTTGANQQLKVQVTAAIQAKLDVRTLMRMILWNRPTQDFGYTFAAERLTRLVTNGEANVPSTSTVVAVVSCGFLRLLQPKSRLTGTDALQRLSTDLASGQLELDIAQYRKPPTVEDSRPGIGKCVLLYSQGQPSRKVSRGIMASKVDAEERLCGDDRSVGRIAEAIAVQVQRFNSDRAKAERWRFGTREVGDLEYSLPAGMEPVPLNSIIDSL